MPEYLLILLRSTLAFGVLLVLARLMGKKQISQLTFFDYIVGITVGNMAASLAIDPGVKISNALIGLTLWGLIPILFSVIGLKSYRFRHLVDGHPTVLIQDGKILEENMKKEKMNTSDLMLELRQKNTFNVADVEFAVMETNGKLSVMKKSGSQPLTPQAFGLQIPSETDPRLVVLNGYVMEHTLRELGYTKQWLSKELKKQGISNVREVFLAQIDSKGRVYADLNKDDPESPQVQRQVSTLVTSLKKTLNDLEGFALQIENPHIQQTFIQQAHALKKSIDQLQPALNRSKTT